MAQVQITPSDIDDNDRIEQAIFGLLSSGQTAEILISSIEKGYDVIEEGQGDEDEIVEGATLAENCDAICTQLAKRLNSPVEYSVNGDTVKFRMVTARPK